MRKRLGLAVGVFAITFIGAITGFVDGVLVGSGKADAAGRRDPVINAVEDVGDAISGVFNEFGKSFGRAGNDIERLFTGRSARTVAYNRKYKRGTIVVSTRERRLYYVVARGKALRYSVGVGRQGFTWSGKSHVSRKAKWPAWRPPEEMLKRRPDLPRYMAGGPNNPLGARALYLGSTLYRIHGTREAHTIGGAVSSGCIRMLNSDVIDLYKRVKVGAPVYVYH